MRSPRIVAALLAAATLVFVACGDDDDGTNQPAPSNTPTVSTPTNTGGEPTTAPATPTRPAPATPTKPAPSTPTQPPANTPDDCPDADEAVCDLARELDSSLHNGNWGAAVDLAWSRNITCPVPGASQGYDPDARVCEDKADGTVVKGYDTGRTYSEGATLDRANMEAFYSTLVSRAHVASNDAFGGGALRMYTIATSPGMGDGFRSLVFSRVVNGEGIKLREAVFFMLEERDGEWGIRSTLVGLQMGDEIVVKLAGGTSNGMTYTVWNPTDGTKEVVSKGLWYGAAVKITDTMGDCLNIRTDPHLGSELVACLDEGSLLTVVGDPVTVNGVVFWNVAGSGSLRGYASGDYLTVSST